MNSTPPPKLSDSPSYIAFCKSPFFCVKSTSYFHVYDKIFADLRDRAITFVEIGVFEGGSLHMWRDFFGKQARIIGVDLNPAAEKFRDDGFEIFIGDQSQPEFWIEFFQNVGQIDVLLDDGGHRFSQQIITVEHALPFVKDGGLIVVEDTHTSYMKEFGGPSSKSFVSYAKDIVDGINLRYESIRTKNPEVRVHSVQFFDSMVVFAINRPQCVLSSLETNSRASMGNEDFRWHGDQFRFNVFGIKFSLKLIRRLWRKLKRRELNKYFRYGKRF